MTSSLAGDWWRNAVEAGARADYERGAGPNWDAMHTGHQQEWRDDASAVLRASLPIVLAELTRRIDAVKAPARGERFYAVGNTTLNEGVDRALEIVAGLAGEADTT